MLDTRIQRRVVNVLEQGTWKIVASTSQPRPSTTLAIAGEVRRSSGTEFKHISLNLQGHGTALWPFVRYDTKRKSGARSVGKGKGGAGTNNMAKF